MFVQHASFELILRKCPDRRAGERLAHRRPVQIDARHGVGRDISAKGLSVEMREAVSPGDIVRVTLAGAAGRVGDGTTPARVARVQGRSGRFIVGLEFVQ